MTRPLSAALTLIVAGAALPRSALADGDTLRCVQRCGDLQVSVFTAPTPLRAGTAEISVLVQDAATGEVLPEAQVMLAVSPPDGTAPHRATGNRETATNKLMLAALVRLNQPGRWHVTVECTRREESSVSPGVASAAENIRRALELDLDVGPPLPRWLAFWPWFAGPLAVVVFFGCHRLLARRP